MAWEYLETEEFDKRLKVVAELLRGKTEGKKVVDLNCGSSRILSYIPRDFAWYWGNDVRSDLITEGVKDRIANRNPWGRLFFSIEKDEKFCRELLSCDVLLCLGCGAGEFTRNGEESETLLSSIQYLLKKFGPETVVIETVQRYFDQYLASAFEEMMGGRYGHPDPIAIEVGPGWVGKRVVIFYEKNAC